MKSHKSLTLLSISWTSLMQKLLNLAILHQLIRSQIVKVATDRCVRDLAQNSRPKSFVPDCSKLPNCFQIEYFTDGIVIFFSGSSQFSFTTGDLILRDRHLTNFKIVLPHFLCSSSMVYSVTRLGDFSQLLMANFLTIVAQIFVKFWVNLKTINF